MQLTLEQKLDLNALYAAHLAELTRRYAPLFAAHNVDRIVLHSGRAKMRTRFDDQFFPHRVVPAFAHWVPVSTPHAAVVLHADGRRALHLEKADNFWERPAAHEWPGFLSAWQTTEHASDEALAATLRGAAKTMVVDEDGQFAALTDASGASDALLRDLDATRVHKTRYEIACLREANVRAAAGHAELARLFQAMDGSEFDLHLAYLKATRQDDQETPYKNIVAFGPNAAILHHISYARVAGDAATSMLVDAGATCLGYASDISRTWVRGHGARVDMFRALNAGMDALQQQTVTAARLGMPYEDLHDASHTRLGALLADAGVVRCSAEEAVALGITRTMLPHGLGHSLGLQTHDVGCAVVKPQSRNPFLRNTSKIEAGQCFTIEPGVYFIDTLMGALRSGPTSANISWDTVDALAPMGGIRVEDDVLVRDDGSIENFTRDAFGALA